jgi:tetratricopeptide (TPR) repeat protein
VADQPRIEELRRRVDADPASIAFAQLAEECRRGGEFEEAVRICRAGLEQHPTYLSARVTLGRALMELGRHDEARAAFEQVLASAPDNLIALRSMSDLHQSLGAEGWPDATRDEQPAPDPRLAELESWLAAILSDRASRAAS